MTAPTIVAGHTTKADTSAQTQRTIDTPTHAEGDIIILAVVTDANSGTISSTDFAAYIFQDRPIKTAGDSTVAIACVMWKEAGASEPATYAIDTSASERVGAICFAVRGSDGSIHQATETNGDSGTATVPAITTTAADCLRVSIVGADGVTQTTPHGEATNHTKIGEAWASSSGAVSAHYKTIASASTDGAETSSLAASEQWIGFSIALAPAGGSLALTPAAASTASTAAPGAVILGSLALTPASAAAAASALLGAIINNVLLTPSAASAAASADIGATLDQPGAIELTVVPRQMALTVVARTMSFTVKKRPRALTVRPV